MKSFKPYRPTLNPNSNKFRDAFNTTKPTKFRDFGNLSNVGMRQNNHINNSSFMRGQQHRPEPTKFRSLIELPQDRVQNPDQSSTRHFTKRNEQSGLKTFRNIPKSSTQSYKPQRKIIKTKSPRFDENLLNSCSKMTNRPESYNDGWDIFNEPDNVLNCIVGNTRYKVIIPKKDTKEDMRQMIQNINNNLTTYKTPSENRVPLFELYLNIKYCVEDWDNIVNLIENKKYDMETILGAISYDSYKLLNIGKQHKVIKKKLKQIAALKRKPSNLNLEQKTKLENEDLFLLKKNTIEHILNIIQSP